MSTTDTKPRVSDELYEALLLILDQVDYKAGNCGLIDMVAAVLPEAVIDKARAAIDRHRKGRQEPDHDEPSSAEKVAQACRALRTELDIERATIRMAVDRLGGTVEGRPTIPLNFLQRIDELRRIETEREAERQRIQKLVVAAWLAVRTCHDRHLILREALAPFEEHS